MPVTEAEHGQRVQPNHIYVIPPNTQIALAGGLLQVSPRGERRGPHLPIDSFFHSLSEDQGSRAIAVVLSGTGSDGTQGVCEVKAVGGITFAQDEESAVHIGMPRSATDSGCVDFVMPPAQIAERLASLGDHPYLDTSSTAEEPTAEESYRRICRRSGGRERGLQPRSVTPPSSAASCGGWRSIRSNQWRSTRRGC